MSASINGTIQRVGQFSAKTCGATSGVVERGSKASSGCVGRSVDRIAKLPEKCAQSVDRVSKACERACLQSSVYRERSAKWTSGTADKYTNCFNKECNDRWTAASSCTVQPFIRSGRATVKCSDDSVESTCVTVTRPGDKNTVSQTGRCTGEASDSASDTMFRTGPKNTFSQTAECSSGTGRAVIKSIGDSCVSLDRELKASGESTCETMSRTGPKNTFSQTAECSSGTGRATKKGIEDSCVQLRVDLKASSVSTRETMTTPGPKNTFSQTGACLGAGSDSTYKTITLKGPENTITQTGGCLGESFGCIYDTMIKTGPENTVSQTGKCSSDTGRETFAPSFKGTKDGSDAIRETMTTPGPKNTFSQTGASLGAGSDSTYKTMTLKGPENTISQTGACLGESFGCIIDTTTKTGPENTISQTGKCSSDTGRETGLWSERTSTLAGPENTVTMTVGCAAESLGWSADTMSRTGPKNTFSKTGACASESFGWSADTMSRTGPKNTFSKTGACAAESFRWSADTMSRTGPKNTFSATGRCMDGTRLDTTKALKAVCDPSTADSIASGKWTHGTMTKTGPENTISQTSKCSATIPEVSILTGPKNTVSKTGRIVSNTFDDTFKSTFRTFRDSSLSMKESWASYIDGSSRSWFNTSPDDGRGVFSASTGTRCMGYGGDREQATFEAVDKIVDAQLAALIVDFKQCLTAIQTTKGEYALDLSRYPTLMSVIQQIQGLTTGGDSESKIRRLKNVIYGTKTGKSVVGVESSIDKAREILIGAITRIIENKAPLVLADVRIEDLSGREGDPHPTIVRIHSIKTEGDHKVSADGHPAAIATGMHFTYSEKV